MVMDMVRRTNMLMKVGMKMRTLITGMVLRSMMAGMVMSMAMNMAIGMALPVLIMVADMVMDTDTMITMVICMDIMGHRVSNNHTARGTIKQDSRVMVKLMEMEIVMAIKTTGLGGDGDEDGNGVRDGDRDCDESVCT